MEKKVSKFFTVDNFEKEEQFLIEMASKGWYFTHYENLKYHFQQAASKDFQYRIDYHNSSDGDLDDYLQLFEDSGWESVFTYPILDGYWCYFRKEAKESENTEIYTDNTSKIELFKKIRLKWGIFGLLITFGMLPLILLATASDFVFTNFIVAFAIGFVVLLYVKLVLNLTRKINQLKE